MKFSLEGARKLLQRKPDPERAGEIPMVVAPEGKQPEGKQPEQPPETAAAPVTEAPPTPAIDTASARGRWEAIEPARKAQFLELLQQRQELQVDQEKSRRVWGRLKNWIQDRNIRHDTEITSVDTRIDGQFRDLVDLHHELLTEDPTLLHIEHDEYRIDAKYLRNFLKEFFDKWNYSKGTETTQEREARTSVLETEPVHLAIGDIVSVTNNEGKTVVAEVADVYDDGTCALTYDDDVDGHKIGDEVTGENNIVAFSPDHLLLVHKNENAFITISPILTLIFSLFFAIMNVLVVLLSFKALLLTKIYN